MDIAYCPAVYPVVYVIHYGREHPGRKRIFLPAGEILRGCLRLYSEVGGQDPESVRYQYSGHGSRNPGECTVVGADGVPVVCQEPAGKKSAELLRIFYDVV